MSSPGQDLFPLFPWAFTTLQLACEASHQEEFDPLALQCLENYHGPLLSKIGAQGSSLLTLVLFADIVHFPLLVLEKVQQAKVPMNVCVSPKL